MKIYVDELPKRCIDCPCESEGFCNLIPLDYCYDIPPKECPLQSLADHDKQVKREVCEEIKDLVAEHNGFLGTYDIAKILDQIQGE